MLPAGFDSEIIQSRQTSKRTFDKAGTLSITVYMYNNRIELAKLLFPNEIVGN